MGIKNGNVIARLVIIGLFGLISIIAYQSFAKQNIETKEPIIVSANMSNLENNDDDKPLQIVAREDFDNIKGLNEYIGATGNNEIIARIGLSKTEIEELYKKYKKPLGIKEEISFINEQGGGLYKINLTTFEKTPLKTAESEFNDFEGAPIMSPNGRKLMHIPYILDELAGGSKPAIIYDLNDKSIINIDASIDSNIDPKDVIYRNWSQDSRYIIGISIDEEVFSIIMLEVEKNQFRKLKIDNQFKVNPLGTLFSEDGKYIYFVGWQNKTPGIFRLDVESGNTELAMALQDKINSEGNKSFIRNYPYKVINDGKSIVFMANIDGEDGLYIYNADSKGYTKIAESVGDPIVPYWIAPDNKNIIYATHYKGKDKKGFWNVYAAKLVGSKLENKILISQDIEYPGMPIVSWSNDSKTAIMYEPHIFTLDTRVFVEKGIIRKIRFIK
jgi:Tol biopolymer transport system component